jgi:transcriptional regulator with GAF, ATPase, and Fis domain
MRKGLKMNSKPYELKELEEKDLLLWVLLIASFLTLGLFLVCLIFYSDLSKFFEENQHIFSSNFLFVAYGGLSLFLVANIILREVANRRLRRSLLKERINLSTTLDKHYEKLKALFAVSTVVNSEVELPKIFEMISRTALNCLEGDRSSLMIYDAQEGKFYCASAHGNEIEKVKDACVDAGKSVCGWVMKHGNPLLLSHEQIDNYSFSDLIEKERTINSALCVPLRVKGKVKGVLNVNSLSKDKTFTEEDLSLLSIFADNAAISIERAGVADSYEDFRQVNSQSDKTEVTVND